MGAGTTERTNIAIKAPSGADRAPKPHRARPEARERGWCVPCSRRPKGDLPVRNMRRVEPHASIPPEMVGASCPEAGHREFLRRRERRRPREEVPVRPGLSSAPSPARGPATPRGLPSGRIEQQPTGRLRGLWRPKERRHRPFGPSPKAHWRRASEATNRAVSSLAHHEAWSRAALRGERGPASADSASRSRVDNHQLRQRARAGSLSRRWCEARRSRWCHRCVRARRKTSLDPLVRRSRPSPTPPRRSRDSR